jgi:hypothetical protein
MTHHVLTSINDIFSINQVPKSAVTNPDDLELWLKVFLQVLDLFNLMLPKVVEHMVN